MGEEKKKEEAKKPEVVAEEKPAFKFKKEAPWDHFKQGGASFKRNIGKPGSHTAHRKAGRGS
jgi:hypothetical protein